MIYEEGDIVIIGKEGQVSCDLCGQHLEERGPWGWQGLVIVCWACESSNTQEELEESLTKLRKTLN